MNNFDKTRVTAEIDSADFDLVEIATKGFSGSDKHGFGWTGPEEFARASHGADATNGPRLYAYGLCTVLHNGPITARRPKIFVRTGDVIKVRNLVARGHLREFYFEATVCSRGYVNFEFVGATESKMGDSRPLEFETKTLTQEEYSVYLQKEFDANRK